MSDDGAMALVVIAMVGNPFSPDYDRARRRGPASALRFASMNVALYGRDRRASGFALHERPMSSRDRNAWEVGIGRSTMRWEGDRLVVDLDERTTPLGHFVRRPVRGRVTLVPESMPGLELPIDGHGMHRWWPVAPLARVEVELREPALRFSGHGYHDVNAGDVPLQASFERWSWSRARLARGAAITYDVACSSGEQRSLAFTVGRRGEVEVVAPSRRVSLPRSAWGLARDTRVDPSAPVRLVRSLEDGPFYTRALVETRLAGEVVVAMHETLAAHRLRRPWVRFCTAYRMRVDGRSWPPIPFVGS